MVKAIHGNIAYNDLARRRQLRDQIDLLRSRIGLLTGKDKLLMTMHLENGNSFRQLADLSGSNPATISRRIHKLASRLTGGEYIICLRHRDRFSKKELEIARDYFLTGLSQMEITRQQQWSIYRVKKTITRIRRRIKIVEKSRNDFRRPAKTRAAIKSLH